MILWLTVPSALPEKTFFGRLLGYYRITFTAHHLTECGRKEERAQNVEREEPKTYNPRR
jgi:hypothetical protein